MGFTPDNGSLIGTEGVDVLLQVNNNPAGNFIAALGGNDIISLQQTVSPGVLADYTVYGGAGNDTITALSSPVNTLIQGEAGNDIISINTVGTAGGAIIDSSIRGGAGNDTITLVATGAGATGMVSQGGSGVDSIYASGIFGTSSIRGGAADDTIRFTTDSTIVSSQLNGGEGDDIITNESGTLAGGARRVVTSVLSTISGNAGSDYIDFFANGTSDLLVFGDTAGDEVNSTTPAADGNDVIITDAGDDTIFGGGGSDYIASQSGSDSISGGSGNDSIFSSNGDDSITGGSGNDYIVSGSGDDTVFGDDGADTIFGGSDDDLIFGNSGNDYIGGGSGNDTIDGGAGADDIFGGSGDDTIFGDVGDDDIYGGFGADTIDASNGNDYIVGGEDADLITLGDGTDTVAQELHNLNFGATENTAVGTYSAGTTLTFGNGVDVVTDFALNDFLLVEGTTTIFNGFNQTTTLVNDTADTTHVFMRGVWNGSNDTFTIDGVGSDVILNGALGETVSDWGNGYQSMIVLENVSFNFSGNIII